MFDLACDAPDFWEGSAEKQPNSEVGTAADFLSEDFCVLNGEHFFVRCVLQLPILGAENTVFGFGVWATLSKKNFEVYIESFDEGHDDLGPWFGWFSNRLEGYPDTLNLKCQVWPQRDRQRPFIALAPADHPLVQEQLHGMTFDRLLDIYALYGHDLRKALSDA